MKFTDEQRAELRAASAQASLEYDQWKASLQPLPPAAASPRIERPARIFNPSPLTGRCVYCGAPTSKLACIGHADLLLLDPRYASERAA